jgi:signal transduction histidine kinase
VETLHEDRLRKLIEAGRGLVAELDVEVVLRNLLDVARELTGAAYAAVGILDSSKTSLTRFVTSGVDSDVQRQIGDLPRGRGVLGLLISDASPLRLADVGAHQESYGFPSMHPPMNTFLGVPVIIRGEVYGNLYLTEKAGGEEFTDDDEHSIVILADWAAIAIENGSLYATAEKRRVVLERTVRGLEVTTAIARAVGGETDLGRVLELIAKRARALVHARSLWILLLEGDELLVATVAGEVGDDRAGQRLAVAGSIAETVLRSGKPTRIAEIAGEAPTLPTWLGTDASSALIVPLLFRARPMGVLIAFDRTEDGPEFAPEDQELMTSFAASAAIATHTARSVGEEQLTHTLEGAEQERGRWARELHDETLQGLAAVRMLVAGALRATDSERREQTLREVHQEMGAEIEKLRHLITELRPAELDELGVEAAVETLASRTTHLHGLRIERELDLAWEAGRKPDRLSPQVENTLYRVIQESLTNVVKHAGASYARIRLVETADQVQLEVSDDGHGFDPSSVRPGGFGLIGMRERTSAVGGSVEIKSSVDGGATLLARMPADHTAEEIRAP